VLGQEHPMEKLAKSREPLGKVTVTSFVEEDIKAGLKDLAHEERRSMSQMIALLIERAVIAHRETKAQK
jgi:CopG-like RHH_1 or ribbon-helix-helix domain, RHH_5